MAKMLGIPTMVIYDSDTNKENANEVNQHKKENKALLTISGYSEENEWLADHIIKKDLTAWQTNLTNEITNELGAELKQYEDKAAAFYGNAGNLKKNPLAIAKTLELAWESGIKSKLLIDLTERISTFLNE